MPYRRYKFGYKKSKILKERTLLDYLYSWRTINEVARRMGWTRQTASNYLKKLYNKGRLRKKFVVRRGHRIRLFKRR